MELEDEESTEEIKLNSNLVLTIIIFSVVGLILGTTLIVYLEVSSAKKGCENIDGEYQFKLTRHLCDDKIFNKYQNCFKGKCEVVWGFEEQKINISEFIDE